MALDDTLAGGIVGVSACLTIIRQYHKSVILVPIHSPFGIETVVLHQCGITVGIIGVMLVSYLRGSGGMITVLILIREVIRLCCLCRIYFLYLSKWLAHAPKSHLHAVTCLLGLTTCIYQTV